MHKHDFAFYRPRLDDFLLSQPTETPWEVEGAARLFLHVLCTFSKVEEILWRCYSQRSRIREKSSYIVLSFLETLLASSNFPPSPPPASPFFLLLLVLQFSSLPFFSPAFLSAAASALSSSSPFSSAVLLFADVALVSWGRTGKVGRRRREGGRGRFEMEKFFFSLRSADWSLSRRRTWAQAGFARFPPFRSDDQRKNPLPRQTCVSREQILYNVLTALSLDFFFLSREPHREKRRRWTSLLLKVGTAEGRENILPRPSAASSNFSPLMLRAKFQTFSATSSSSSSRTFFRIKTPFHLHLSPPTSGPQNPVGNAREERAREESQKATFNGVKREVFIAFLLATSLFGSVGRAH